MYRTVEKFLDRLNRFLPEELEIDRDFPERVLDKEIIEKVRKEQIFSRIRNRFDMTPSNMGEFLIKLLPMGNRKIFVSNCRDGQTIVDLKKEAPNSKIYAETFNPYDYYLSCLNLALNEVDTSILHKKQKAKIVREAEYDVVLCEEIISHYSREFLDGDFGVLDYLYSQLKPNGYLILCGDHNFERFVLRDSKLQNQIPSEIKTVFDFPNSAFNTKILVLQKGVQADDIFFINGSSLLMEDRRSKEIFNQEELLKIYNERESQIDISQLVSPEKFAENEFSLDALRYIEITPKKPLDIVKCYEEIATLGSEIAEIDDKLKSKLLRN